MNDLNFLPFALFLGLDVLYSNSLARNRALNRYFKILTASNTKSAGFHIVEAFRLLYKSPYFKLSFAFSNSPSIINTHFSAF